MVEDKNTGLGKGLAIVAIVISLIALAIGIYATTGEGTQGPTGPQGPPGGGDGHSLDAADGSPTDAVYVNDDGNVGIGVISSYYKLGVVGNGIFLRDSNSTSRKELRLRTDGPALDVQADNADLIVQSTTGNLILQPGSGVVGIGTGTPERTLHISDVMRLEPRGSAPGSPGEGDIYANSSDHHLYYYNGSSWVQIG